MAKMVEPWQYKAWEHGPRELSVGPTIAQATGGEVFWDLGMLQT